MTGIFRLRIGHHLVGLSLVNVGGVHLAGASSDIEWIKTSELS